MTTANFIDKLPRPLKFAMVGAIAAAVHFSVVLLLVETLDLKPLLANIFAFLTAFCVSFSGQKLFTFADRQKSLRDSLGPYFLISLISFGCNELLFSIALYLFHVPYQLALLMVLLIVAIGTYLGSKYWAFSSS